MPPETVWRACSCLVILGALVGSRGPRGRLCSRRSSSGLIKDNNPLQNNKDVSSAAHQRRSAPVQGGLLRAVEH